jgi:anti-sigma factor RsiW
MLGAREGELAAAEDAALRAHLATCETCRALAADLAATDGMVSEALLAAASRRDFAPFVDEVMARVAADGRRTAATVPSHGAASRANGAARPKPVPARETPGFLGWLTAHRRAAFGALAPVLAAAALLVYVRRDAGPAEVASLEFASEGEVTMILQTSDGPVVLLSAEES